MTTRLYLDHVGVLVSDLEAARRAYERLGFRLTAESAHEGRLTPDGPIETWGTGNRCAMFDHGYLELLGIIDSARYHDHVRERLARYQGLQLIALGCPDADAVRARWALALDGIRPVVELGRAVPQLKGGARAAGFRIVYLDRHFPEAQIFAIEHVDPAALWQPALLEQPNGVVALRGVTIVAADPRATAGRLSAVGLDGAAAPDGWWVPLAQGGWIDILSPSVVGRRFPGETPPAVPSVLGAAYEVTDIGVTARHLERAGVAMQAGDGRIWVSARDAQGCVVEFLARGVGADEE